MTVTVEDIRIYPVKALRGTSLPASDVAIWGLDHDRRWMVVKPDGKFITQRELPAMARIDARATADGLTLANASAHENGAEADGGLRVPVPGSAAERRQVLVWSSEVPALDAGPEVANWLSEQLGLACGLVYLADPYARPVDPDYATPDDRVLFSDGFPVLLANTASLEALNTALPSPIGMTRFRPNIVMNGVPAWAEDRWRRIRIGEVEFRVAKPCARCAVTTVDQITGERPDKTEPLRTLGRIRRTADGVMFGQNLIPDGPGRVAVGDAIEILEVGESNVVLLQPDGD
ncbi:MOSC domain-containing protein [Acidisoma sp.]|uniref:MOSC domain-containing protein n=1 Tax=Acidisoma sp. TaxID=1872115 RepID=UPI003AFF9159